ncbi:transporter substrate-binding domain-containing protein [Actinoplanes sp. DH11]|uniref:transporter substrate-binding domain-containing protein n=1 Tax=Actinoplanes sp. DH11 TaxID=2857011 RepID=UPI001E2DD82E|nr:transporter substrate-binding domain-containing protein [Actinoplanes sp. DH11]
MVDPDDREPRTVRRRFRQWQPPDLPWLRRRLVPPPDVTVEEIASRDIAEQEVFEEVYEEAQFRSLVDWEHRFRAWRLAGLGVLLVLTLAVTMSRLLIGGPPSVADLRAEAGVDDWTTLNIGVKDDQYGVAYYDAGDEAWAGFDIDIAYMIAEDLGFRRDDVRFFGLESEDRARMQATDAQGNRVPVQLVIASYSVTDARKAAGVHFSAPYLLTEQSVITLNDHPPVSALEDLEKQRVCTLSTSTSQTALERAEAIVSRKNRVRECFAELDRGTIDAISTDAAILAGWKHRFPAKYEHWDLGLDTVERWGVNVGNNPALEKLVNLTLYRSYADPKDSRWERAYQEHLQSEIDTKKRIPIADGRQPRVERPDVRRLPWEDPLG